MTRFGHWLTTVLEMTIALLAISYLFFGDIKVLLAWEVVVVAYLVGGFALVVVQAKTGVHNGRHGVLGALSWVLPLVASAAGVGSAVLALSAQTSAARGERSGILVVVAASTGIILSWLLLQVGMAQSYGAMFVDTDGHQGLRFPVTDTPLLIDFVYFSFGVGAAFATSDTQVLSRCIRLVVVIHSSVAFFYSAFVVAVAYQVLQNALSR